MTKLATRRNRVNKALTGLDNYHNAIPLDKIQKILAKHGFMMLQEDNTEWAGFFCGDEGRADFNLTDTTKANYAYLRLSESGELVDATRMPDNGVTWEFTSAYWKPKPGNSPYSISQETISKEEYETFHAMDMQTMDVYDESTMRWNPITCMLCMTWYKMPSGRYEIVAYMS